MIDGHFNINICLRVHETVYIFCTRSSRLGSRDDHHYFNTLIINLISQFMKLINILLFCDIYNINTYQFTIL